MTQNNFKKLLKKSGYSFEIKDKWIVVTQYSGLYGLYRIKSLPDYVSFNNNGTVDLSSLRKLPPNIEFNNKGGVYFSNLEELKNNVVFNNTGVVTFGKIKDVSNAGRRKRNLCVYKHKRKGLVISLGCFVGTKKQAIKAVKANYHYSETYNHSERDAYIDKINKAFDIAEKFYGIKSK